MKKVWIKPEYVFIPSWFTENIYSPLAAFDRILVLVQVRNPLYYKYFFCFEHNFNDNDGEHSD